MKDGVCVYHKYGFCKFKDLCRRKHYEEKCEDSVECKGAKHCQKRHPKVCKKYNSEKGCQFGCECAYSHNISVKSKEPTNDLEKKVEILETIVIEMAKKLITLEDELKDIKSGQNKNKAATKNTENICEAVKITQVEEQYKSAEKNKEEVDKPDKGIANLEKPHFKCYECGEGDHSEQAL